MPRRDHPLKILQVEVSYISRFASLDSMPKRSPLWLLLDKNIRRSYDLQVPESGDIRIDDEDFQFVWDQEKYNPVTNEILCHIHFKFADGSELRNAFTYDWRLWTIAEINELLAEAGFSKTHVFWEEYKDSVDDDDYLESTGEYVEVTEVENQESWVSYIFAEK